MHLCSTRPWILRFLALAFVSSHGPAIATAAPAAPVIRSISPDTGEPNDGITSAEQIAIQGTAEPNVSITLNGVGTTQSDADGFWSFGFTGNLDQAGSSSFVATASNNTGTSAESNRFVVWFARAPKIEGALVNARVGQPVDYTQTVLNGAFQNIRVSITGLPPGLQSSNGHITGTPTVAGLYPITVTAEGQSGTDKVTTTLFVHSSGAPQEPPPASWFNRDIGPVGVPGSTDTSGNTITVRASGSDIWDSTDGFRFVYREETGDCLVETQVTSITNTDAWSKAGVMIRESATAAARNVFLCLNPSNVLVIQNRSQAGGTTSSSNGWWLSTGTWVRLVRTGDNFAAFSSKDGQNWTLRGSLTVAMPANVLVGFAVTAHNNTQLATGVFTDPYVQ